jgi:hypothetical protein
VRSLGVRLAGDAIDEVTERGGRITGDTLLLLLNADANALEFTLPPNREGQYWEELVDTSNGMSTPEPLHGGDRYEVQGRSMAVFRLSVPKRRRRTDNATDRESQAERRQPETVGAQSAAPVQRPVTLEEPEPAVVGEQRSDEPAIAR